MSKKLKKMIALSTAIVFVISFVSCNSNEASESSEVSSSVSSSVSSEVSSRSVEDSVYSKYETMTEQEVSDYLSGLDSDELLEEVKTVFDELDTASASSGIMFAAELESRINEFEESVIVNELIDLDTHVFFRITLLQSYDNGFENKTDDAKEQILALVKDYRTEPDYVDSISNFVELEQMDLYAIQFYSEDEYVSSTAIFNLFDMSPTRALELAVEVLNNYPSYSVTMIKPAISVIAHGYTMDRNKDVAIMDNFDFIAKCIDFIENSDSQAVVDVAIISLSGMGDIDAVKYIIDSEKVSDQFKRDCIYNNHLILKDMIADDDYFDTAIEAIMMYPVDELEVDLITAKNNTDDEDKIAKIDGAISKIKTSGVSVGDATKGLY